MKILKYSAVLLLLIFIHFYLYGSEYLKRADYKFYDSTRMVFSQIKEQKEASYAVVVDIDEKSLQQLGQWPWPRVIDAKLIDTVHELTPSAIGVNILFPERDRVSPVAIQDFYKKFFNLKLQLDDFPLKLKDNDKILANSIKMSGATLATYFNNSTYTSSHCESLSYKENLFSTIKAKLNAPAFLCNYKTLQNSTDNFGFINAWKDSDGILRRVPLFMDYKGRTFPSFPLATLLSFDKHVKPDIDNSSILIDSFKKFPKVFSAIDVLNGKVALDEIQGKIVIIGSSVVGLDPTYVTSSGKIISNNMIHALVVDSILSDTLLTQPELYKKIAVFISLLFSILLMIMFIQRVYIKMAILFFLALIISILGLFYAYSNGFYISIGYFWTPLLSVFTLFIIYHSIEINKSKQEQEKFLIVQSKLASMGEMIALIAHQWRQPLSAINGIVMSIDVDHRKKILNDEKLDKHLNEIEDRTAYLSKTINDFTDFFSKNKQSETFSIKDIVRQTESLTVISSHKNIEITYTQEEDIEVVGYSSELIQSLLVLLNNAIYVCQKRFEHSGKGKIVIHARKEKSTLYISVEDNGGGVASKDIKKIFNPYFTTKNRENGTGLGLYILKLIIEESMHGKISVHNGKEGAVFTIQIPNKH